MVIDHVVLLVPDAEQAATDLRKKYVLGSERAAYLPHVGTRGHNVPLKPPSYLEYLAIENREAAEATEPGRPSRGDRAGAKGAGV
jgi:hypothetical protein